MSPPTVLVLGATGFLGGHLLELLNIRHPELRLICLVRDPTPGKNAALKRLNSQVEILEGTLEDGDVISGAAGYVDAVIHIAHSDHVASVEAILRGLKRRTAKNSQKRPLYLHMSGLGIIADNVRGEHVDDPKEWTDIGLRLDEYVLLLEEKPQPLTAT